MADTGSLYDWQQAQARAKAGLGPVVHSFKPLQPAEPFPTPDWLGHLKPGDRIVYAHEDHPGQPRSEWIEREYVVGA